MCIDEQPQLNFIISEKLSGCKGKSFDAQFLSEAPGNENLYGFAPKRACNCWLKSGIIS